MRAAEPPMVIASARQWCEIGGIVLSAEEQKIFTTWLAKRVKIPNCPVCGANAWEPTGPHILVPFDHAVTLLGGPGSMPVVSLVCGNCFHIRFFAWGGIKHMLEEERNRVSGTGV